MSDHLTVLHFVRHGEVHNQQAIFYGRLPRYGLSALGRRQAEATAEFLAHTPIAAIYTSPMLRARQTAAIIASRHPELRVRVSVLLNEVSVPLQGRSIREGMKLNWDLYTGNEPPYETVERILDRMLRFVTRARRLHAGREIVAVTHGDPIGFLLLWAQGRPVTAANKAPLYLDWLALASVTSFVFHTNTPDERPEVRYTVPWV